MSATSSGPDASPGDSTQPAIRTEFRLKFYGTGDYGTYYQVARAVQILRTFDPAEPPTELNDVLELFNAQQFVDARVLPTDLGTNEMDALSSRVSDVPRVLALFFAGVTNATARSLLSDVDFQYQDDLLQLLVKFKVHERCSATELLGALRDASVTTSELLGSKAVVQAYDADIKSLIASDPQNAELIIAKHCQPAGERPIHLPQSWTPADSRLLLDGYLDDESANPNLVRMLATARISKLTGIDKKLKLKAKRTYDAIIEKFFAINAGIKTGVEVIVSKDQQQDVVTSLEGMVATFSYGQAWLDENLDFPTILNNFIYVFEFATAQMQWLLPSFAAELGTIEGLMIPSGKESYRTGSSFRMKNQSSFLQTVMYDQFLRSKEIELEGVLAWFFEDYLRDQFGAENFKFKPSSPTATYLEKSRHLFAEMESLLKQFSLYAEEGEVDLELLSMASEQLAYRDIPTLMDGKYIYTTQDPTIRRVLHLLFSDQSHITYINEGLRDRCFAQLIVRNNVSHGTFHEYQREEVNFLIAEGIVENTDDGIKIASVAQFRVLQHLWQLEAASYYHCTSEARAAVDDMVTKGWLERRGALLTGAEASYVNYFLNQSEFTNGPDLRNRYLHGSQADGDDKQIHAETYITALRMLIALVIKINDDFSLRADEASSRRETLSDPG